VRGRARGSGSARCRWWKASGPRPASSDAVGRPGPSEKIPGRTQSRCSFDGDEDVGAVPVGGDGEGRAARAREGSSAQGWSDHLGEGSFTGATRVAGQPAARIRGQPGHRRLMQLRRRSCRTVRGSAPRERCGRNAAEVGIAFCAARVGDTAEAHDRSSLRSSQRSARTGSPARTKREVSVEGASDLTEAKNRSRGLVVAVLDLGFVPWLRMRPGADAGGRCCALRGKPAERRGIRGTPAERRSEKKTLRDRSVGSPKWARRREPGAPVSRGNCDAACAETWGDHL
jgi:hypothetical protein